MKKIISVLLVAAMVLSVCYIPAFAAKGENLALNKPVTAVSEWGGAYLMKCVNDGKMDTAWSEGSVRLNPKDEEGNTWIQIDLGSRYDITSMIAYSRSDVNSASERMGWIYQVSETADFAEKTVIGIKKSAGTPGSGYEAKPLEPVAGRYVRVACAQYIVIAEIEVYGTPAAAVSKGEYNDVAQEGELYNASQLAYNLGIMDGVGGGDFGVNHLMTRAEAAQVVAKLAKSGDLKPVDTGFNDVKADNKMSGYIAWCENSMIISKDAEFRPDDYITGNEFAVMLLRLNGWWEVMSEGKYPEMVETLAKKSKLIDGVDIVMENDLNRGQALLMMKNVLLNESIKAIGVDEEEGVIYEKTRDEFYLYDVYGYELLDGIVDSHVLSDLVEPKDGADNAVTVDGVEYLDLSGKMNAFLGERVWYLFDPAKNQIIGAWRNPDIGSSVTIQCDQISSSDETLVEYWEEGKNKVQKLRLEAPVYFIKNGVASGDYTPNDLKSINGRVVFIDNDNNGRYDVIKLYEPKVLLFEYISDNNNNLVIGGKALTTDAEGNTSIESQNFVYENYEMLSTYLNGFAVNHKELSGEMLVYIFASDNGKYVELELSNKTVEGKIEKILDDNFVINGDTYERSEYYAENADMMDKVKVGAECTFLLDMNGKIVWATTNNITISPEALGVIYLMANPEGFGNYQFKVFNQSGEHVELTAANKVIIDGKECGRNEIKELGSEYFIGKLILYKLDSSNKIRFMDTENYNPVNEPDSWLIKQDKWSLPSGSLRNPIGFYSESGVMVMPFFEDFKVFTIPNDPTTNTLITDDALLSRYTYSDMSSMAAINSDTNIIGTFTFYGLEDDLSPRIAYRLFNTNTTLNVQPLTAYTSNSTLVVEKVGTYMDGDMMSYFIRGYNPLSGLSVDINLPYEIDRVLDSHRVYTNVTDAKNNGIGFTGLNYVSAPKSTNLLGYSSPIDDIKLGDVIRYESSNSIVTALERIYSPAEGSPSLTFDGTFINTGDNCNTSGGFKAGYRALSSNVSAVENGVITVGSESFKYASTDAKAFIVVEDGEIIAESINVLPNYVSVNDRVLLLSFSGRVSGIIAYK